MTAGPLKFKGLDHVIRAVPDLAPAYEAMARLGIHATPPGPAANTGNLNTFFNVGGADNLVAVEYISLPPDAPVNDHNAEVARLIEAGGGMFIIAFHVESLEPARAAFAERGGYVEREIKAPEAGAEGVDPIWNILKDGPIRTLMPNDTAAAGCRFLILEYPPAVLAFREQTAGHKHDFPITRVDHICVIPPDFEAGARYWTEVLGAQFIKDVTVNDVLVRQMQAGDVVVELLKPGPNSPIPDAPVGLRSMISFEVPDIHAAVELARSRGFKIRDPQPTATPGAMTTMISPKQTCDLAFHFVQYDAV